MQNSQATNAAADDRSAAIPTRVTLRLSDLRPFVEPLLNLSQNRSRESRFNTAVITSQATAAAVRRSLSRSEDDAFIIDIPSLDQSTIASGSTHVNNGQNTDRTTITTVPGAAAATTTTTINNMSPNADQDDQSTSDNNNDLTENTTNNANSLQQMETVVDFIETLCRVLRQYAIWILLFGIKFCLDHSRMMCYSVIQIVHFMHINRHIKDENNRLDQRHNLSLLVFENIVSFFVAFPLQSFFFDYTSNWFMVFIHPIDVPMPVDFWSIFWTTSVIDINLKLITTFIKSILILLLQLNNRSKYFVFVESVSQLYRTIVPIQFWFNYLMKPTSNTMDIIISWFLTGCYSLLKMQSIVSKLRFVRRALPKLFQKSHIGPRATEEQIQNWAENCPICFGTYNSPIILSCKHIFCEECIQTWLDRMQSCPVCRIKIIDDSDWRNGRTTQVIEFF